MPPDLKRIDRCRGCGAAVVWVSTSTGAKMQVDAEPTPGGNLVLLSNVDRKWVAIVVGVADANVRAPGERYTSHFATCPKASEFRRHRRTKPKPKPATGMCVACGHIHAGAEWAFICIGCPCPETPGRGK